MRIRNVVAAVGAATLLVALPALPAAPAAAGTGTSTHCSDGIGYREIPILTSPVTVGVEINRAPAIGESQYLLICYSTTAVGQPGVVTGGAIAVHVVPGANTVYPGAYVGLGCYPDFATGVGPACAFSNSANVAPADVAVATNGPAVCLVAVLGNCVAYVPGVRLATGSDPRPFLGIQLLSVPVAVDLPAVCVPVTYACP